jgi:hypothetical protein
MTTTISCKKSETNRLPQAALLPETPEKMSKN